MGLEAKASGSESRFTGYVEAITSALGHADRAAPFRSYCTGLLLPGDRKSVEPMAARVQPGRVQAAHQSLHHFVAKADWSDDAVLAAVRACVLPIIEWDCPVSVDTDDALQRGVRLCRKPVLRMPLSSAVR